MSAGDSESKKAETGTAMSAPASNNITDQMMQNPGVLAALQKQLDSMVGQGSGYVDSLPTSVKRRIKALKNLQMKSCKIECQFYKEVHDLEQKYAAQYEPIYNQRREIVAGRYEPTEEECQWKDEEEEEDESSETKEKNEEVNAIAKKVDEDLKLDENTKGIPNFWLTIFKSSPLLQEMVQDHDEPILEKLEDIKFILSEPDKPMNFVLEFHFADNEYFGNKVLKKTYKLLSEPHEDEPFSFEGPEIVSSKGCKIDWKKGKNVTVKTVKKRQKHKNKGTVRTVSKEVPADSFFNFFDPPQAEDDEELDDDMEALLATDIEIGHLLRERVIPRAVLFFTGEASDDEYDEEEEDDSENEYGLDDNSDENDADYDPEKDPNAKDAPQECNQQ